MRRLCVALTFVALIVVGSASAPTAQGKPPAKPPDKAAQATTPSTPAESPTPIPEAKSAPVLSEIDGLRLENAFLRLGQQQQVTDKLKADLQTLLGSLQKPGYIITQLPDGKLGYAPEPKKEK